MTTSGAASGASAVTVEWHDLLVEGAMRLSKRTLALSRAGSAITPESFLSSSPAPSLQASQLPDRHVADISSAQPSFSRRMESSTVMSTSRSLASITPSGLDALHDMNDSQAHTHSAKPLSAMSDTSRVTARSVRSRGTKHSNLSEVAQSDEEHDNQSEHENRATSLRSAAVSAPPSHASRSSKPDTHDDAASATSHASKATAASKASAMSKASTRRSVARSAARSVAQSVASSRAAALSRAGATSGPPSELSAAPSAKSVARSAKSVAATAPSEAPSVRSAARSTRSVAHSAATVAAAAATAAATAAAVTAVAAHDRSDTGTVARSVRGDAASEAPPEGSVRSQRSVSHRSARRSTHGATADDVASVRSRSVKPDVSVVGDVSERASFAGRAPTELGEASIHRSIADEAPSERMSTRTRSVAGSVASGHSRRSAGRSVLQSSLRSRGGGAESVRGSDQVYADSVRKIADAVHASHAGGPSPLGQDASGPPPRPPEGYPTSDAGQGFATGSALDAYDRGVDQQSERYSVSGGMRGLDTLPGQDVQSNTGAMSHREATNAGSEYAGSQYRGSQYTGSQYPGSQHAGSQYAGSQYAGSQYAGSQYAGSQYAGSQYAGSVRGRDAVDAGSQYAGSTRGREASETGSQYAASVRGGNGGSVAGHDRMHDSARADLPGGIPGNGPYATGSAYGIPHTSGPGSIAGSVRPPVDARLNESTPANGSEYVGRGGSMRDGVSGRGTNGYGYGTPGMGNTNEGRFYGNVPGGSVHSMLPNGQYANDMAMGSASGAYAPNSMQGGMPGMSFQQGYNAPNEYGSLGRSLDRPSSMLGSMRDGFSQFQPFRRFWRSGGADSLRNGGGSFHGGSSFNGGFGADSPYPQTFRRGGPASFHGGFQS